MNSSFLVFFLVQIVLKFLLCSFHNYFTKNATRWLENFPRSIFVSCKSLDMGAESIEFIIVDFISSTLSSVLNFVLNSVGKIFNILSTVNFRVAGGGDFVNVALELSPIYNVNDFWKWGWNTKLDIDLYLVIIRAQFRKG